MQPQVPAPPPLPQPPNQTPPNKHPLYDSYGPKKRRWPVVVGICVIVLLLAGGVLFFVVSGSDEPDSGSSSPPSRPDYAERTPTEEADDEVDWEVVNKYKAHIEAIEASYDRMEKHAQDCNPEQFNAEVKTLYEINLDYGAVASSVIFASEATDEHTAPLDERYEATDDRFDKMVADSQARYEAGACEFVVGSPTL